MMVRDRETVVSVREREWEDGMFEIFGDTYDGVMLEMMRGGETGVRVSE